MLYILKSLRTRRALVVLAALAALVNAAFVLELGAAPVAAGQCCHTHSDCSSTELCLVELTCPESPFPGFDWQCGRRVDP